MFNVEWVMDNFPWGGRVRGRETSHELRGVRGWKADEQQEAMLKIFLSRGRTTKLSAERGY